jgi:hypothetical protein
LFFSFCQFYFVIILKYLCTSYKQSHFISKYYFPKVFKIRRSILTSNHLFKFCERDFSLCALKTFINSFTIDKHFSSNSLVCSDKHYPAINNYILYSDNSLVILESLCVYLNILYSCFLVLKSNIIINNLNQIFNSLVVVQNSLSLNHFTLNIPKRFIKY